MTYAVLVGYLAVLLGIGIWSARRGARSADDYFLAGRSLGSVVLFMALFGTNVTAFAMIGLPGLAYHHGVGVFGFFGATAAFVTPLLFILIGYPIWLVGKRHGYITQSQMVSDRWQSPLLGYLVFGALVLYTFPYLALGLIGGGKALEQITADVPYELGAGLVALVAVTYTALGGMRGTAWTNVFQASVFLVFLIVACIAIADALGGATVLHERLVTERPELLGKGSGPLTPGMWATCFLVGPASVIAFPHMFMRLLAGKDIRALRRTIHLYPWALVLLFVPVTLIGVWGALDVPGLAGKESDEILPRLVATHLPPILGAFGLAAILAAIMSSLDGQLLTLSTMLTVDIVGRRSGSQALLGRVFVLLVAVAAYVVALKPPASIFGIAAYSFSGYTLIIPLFVAAFFWKRSTAAGMILGSIVGHGLLATYYVGMVAPDLDPKLDRFGVFPVAVCLVAQVVVMVGVSLATRPPAAEVVRKFEDPFGSPDVVGSQ